MNITDPVRFTATFLAAAAVVIAAGCAPRQLPPSAPHELLGTAPKVETRPQLDGDLVELPAAGKVTVIDFWSSYCEPCLESMPHLEQLWRRAGGDQLAVIGVNLDEDPYQTRDTLKEMGITFPQIIDDGHILSGIYRVTAIPAAFVYDKNGTLRFVALSDDYDHGRISSAAELLLSE